MPRAKCHMLGADLCRLLKTNSLKGVQAALGILEGWFWGEDDGLAVWFGPV